MGRRKSRENGDVTTEAKPRRDKKPLKLKREDSSSSDDGEDFVNHKQQREEAVSGLKLRIKFGGGDTTNHSPTKTENAAHNATTNNSHSDGFATKTNNGQATVDALNCPTFERRQLNKPNSNSFDNGANLTASEHSMHAVNADYLYDNDQSCVGHDDVNVQAYEEVVVGNIKEELTSDTECEVAMVPNINDQFSRSYYDEDDEDDDDDDEDGDGVEEEEESVYEDESSQDDDDDEEEEDLKDDGAARFGRFESHSERDLTAADSDDEESEDDSDDADEGDDSDEEAEASLKVEQESEDIDDDVDDDDEVAVGDDVGIEDNCTKDDAEAQWLRALEAGELDDAGDVPKRKNVSVMTVRQRALHGEEDRTEPLQELPMYTATPSQEKPSEEEVLKKTARAQKRKLEQERQNEENRTQTIDKLLHKSDDRRVRGQTEEPHRTLNEPHTRYVSNAAGSFLSFSEGVYFPPLVRAPQSPPVRERCGVAGCTNAKRYACSRTRVPVCGLECYRLVQSRSDEAT